jgi:hypothetical protein
MISATDRRAKVPKVVIDQGKPVVNGLVFEHPHFLFFDGCDAFREKAILDLFAGLLTSEDSHLEARSLTPGHAFQCIQNGFEATPEIKEPV